MRARSVVDFLSFVVSMLEFVVSFAKVVALAALIIVGGFILKALPPRLKRIVSNIATTFLLLAIVRGLLLDSIALSLIKATFVAYTQYAVVIIVVCCMDALSAFATSDVGRVAKQIIPPPRQIDYLKHKMKNVQANTSFFTMSPVLLQ